MRARIRFPILCNNGQPPVILAESRTRGSLKHKKAPARQKRSKVSGKKRIEQYEHKDKQRTYIPPVGLVTPETDPLEAPKQAKKPYQYDPHLDPQLVWAGKAERTSFAVP